MGFTQARLTIYHRFYCRRPDFMTERTEISICFRLSAFCRSLGHLEIG
jgi:hypothetical protein